MATAALIGCTFLSAAASVSADAPPSQAYFTSAGTMTFARFGPAVAPLANGDVLIAGGEGGNGPVSTAELYDPAAGTFTPTAGDLPTSLFGAAAAPLPDGEVLIVGGFSTSGFLASMELYDPTTQTFSSTTSLPQAQGLPTAVPLPGGDVLIAGGETSGGDPAAAEIYDPSAGTFTPTANAVPGGPIRTTGAQLPDGDVLIAGGLSSLNQALTSAAIYDPASRTFTALTSPLAFATADASAAPLPDGDVLIAGGYDGGTLSGAQLYDPITQTFTVTASLPAATDTAGAAGLPNGEVLLTGGENGSAEPVSRAELYVPAAEASLTGGALGDVATGSTSGEAKVVVENVGAQTLQISGLTASGPNAADFTVLSDACEGASLAFGQSCALEVTFTPSEPAAESAELTLADNEATPGAVALSGTGVAPITGAAGNTGPAGNAGPAGATGAAGPAGPTGPVGAAGATGAIGPAGATGSAGATGAAGASGAPGSVSIAACPAATGSASGSRIGRVRLGESRTSAERAYPETSNRGYPDKDFFCLANGDTRVWYPSAAELSSLPRGLRSAVSGRVVWISTANPRYSLDGVRAGDRLNVAKARLRLGAPIKDGLNDWYLVSVSGRTVTLKVQAGEVEEVGVADHELTATHAQQVRLVRSY